MKAISAIKSKIREIQKAHLMRDLDKLERIYIEDATSLKDIKAIIKAVKEYNKKYPIEQEMRRMEEIKLARGLSARSKSP
jgi:ketosteroid isomerase-like protein